MTVFYNYLKHKSSRSLALNTLLLFFFLYGLKEYLNRFEKYIELDSLFRLIDFNKLKNCFLL